MKFQNISIHGPKVTLCTRKRDKQTNEQTSQNHKKLCTIKHQTVILALAGFKPRNLLIESWEH